MSDKPRMSTNGAKAVKPTATIKPKIKKAYNMPKSYVEYKPYKPSKKTEKIKTYGNKVERLI